MNNPAFAALVQELAEALEDRRTLAKPLYYAKGDIVRIAHAHDCKTHAKGTRRVVATHYAGSEGKCFWIGENKWGPGKKAGIKFPGDLVVFVPYGDAVKASTTPEEYKAYQKSKEQVKCLETALKAIEDASEAEKDARDDAEVAANCR